MATDSPATSPADPADDSAIVAAFLSWAAAAPPEEVFALFAVLNIIATSVVPFPLGVAGSVVAGIMYGPVNGTIAYVTTCSIGSWITFVLVRLLRPCVLERLGSHRSTWERLDAAIVREGVQICLLWRIAPIAPFVISSILISMTGITQWQYVWTTSLGIIPSTIPIVSAASLGHQLVTSDHVSPLAIAGNVFSIVAGFYVVYRLAALAHGVLSRSAAEGSDRDAKLMALRAALPRLANLYGESSSPVLL